MNGPKRNTILAVVVIVLVAAAAHTFMVYRWGGFERFGERGARYEGRETKKGMSAEFQPDANLYQVVLLANDQAYYGKLQGINTPYPYLTDVYYLQPQTILDTKGNPTGTNGNFTVIKRGAELHGPTDSLHIAADKILFWENVGEKSAVAQGIAKDKEVRAQGAGQSMEAAPVSAAETPAAAAPAK